jgi:hypothetical protein
MKTIREFRPEDSTAFPQFCDLGIDAEKVPQPAFTAMNGEGPMACGGLINLGLWRAEAWFAFTDPMDPRARWIARNVVRWLDSYLVRGPFRRIQATIPVRDMKLRKWMEFLGFWCESDPESGHVLRAYGMHGEDKLMYSRVRGR